MARSRTYRIIIFLLGMMTSTSALAADRTISSGDKKVLLVELYTSEGCSSCPPAEKWMNTLIDDSQLWQQFVPVAFHVDYWDYIGWKDPYANPRYTQRQRAIARANGQSTIYTPEFVVDGVEARGSRSIGDQVTQTYDSPAEADMVLTLSEVTGGNFTAEVKVDALRHVGEENAELYLVIYESGLQSDVNAGENVGKKLSHDYVVRYLSPAQLTGSGRYHKYELQLGADWNQANVGIAAFVKTQGSGRTLQAVKISL